jgi:hypothetical protein
VLQGLEMFVSVSCAEGRRPHADLDYEVSVSHGVDRSCYGALLRSVVDSLAVTLRWTKETSISDDQG